MTQKEFLDALEIERLKAELAICQRSVKASEQEAGSKPMNKYACVIEVARLLQKFCEEFDGYCHKGEDGKPCPFHRPDPEGGSICAINEPDWWDLEEAREVK